MGQLVGNIYDAALDAARWPAFMENLSSSLNAGFGLLWLHDFSSNAPVDESDVDIAAFTGLDSTSVGHYKSHYAGVNVWLPNASRLAEGSVTVSSRLYPDRLLKSTEFYNDFLGRHGLFYAVGSSILKEGGRDFKMSFVRSERAGRYQDAELHGLRQLMPHLRNAVALHRELSRLKLLAASAVAALELVPAGVVLLTRSGRLLHANHRAHDLFTGTGALRFGPGGTLHACSVGATTTLQRLIDEAVLTTTGKGSAHGGVVQLTGPGGCTLQVRVTPLPAASALVAGDAMAAIICSDPEAGVGMLSRRLEVMYRMSPAEAQLAEALVNGLSLKQYAEARRTTMNTVRTQLKAAAARIGARRQADLVRIILTGPAIFDQGCETGITGRARIPR